MSERKQERESAALKIKGYTNRIGVQIHPLIGLPFGVPLSELSQKTARSIRQALSEIERAVDIYLTDEPPK